VTTPYRNEIDALRERKASLEQELARLREQTNQLDQLRAREAELANELAGVDVRLREGGAKRALPMLDQIRVASPCNAEWNEMVGDERVRFCLSCEKNVYNLSSMTRDAAEALLRERMGNELCVRFYQRADGTILTQDCPEGVKKKRRKKLALAIAGAGAMAAAAATAFTKTTCTKGQAIAGAVAVQGDWAGPTMGDVGPVVETKGEAVMAPPPVDPNVQSPHIPQAPSTGTAQPSQVPTNHVRMGRPAMPPTRR